MTTLVTGASGHVGANLVRSLIAQGRDVRVLIHHNSHALEGLDVERVYGDVCSTNSLSPAFSGVDIVYHLAARVSIEMNCGPELNEINVIGTRNIVAASLKHNIRRLVHFSSIDAIEQKPVHVPVNELSPLAKGKHHSPYDRSKASGEREVMAGIDQGLDAVIINPTAIIGPHDYQPSHQGQMLVSLAHKKLPALVNGGFDWVDARDVVYGAMQAEKLAPRGSRYILGGHWASLVEIAGMVEKVTGIAAPAFICPQWLASLGAPLVATLDHLRGCRPLYTKASMMAIKSNHLIRHAKATEELQYHPRPIEKTINDTLKWFADWGKLQVKLR
jgi:dihydroflavonol-4-reductase